VKEERYQNDKEPLIKEEKLNVIYTNIFNDNFKYKIRKIAIIGLGSLGGFLCRYLSFLSDVKEIVIIDNDIVENKNLKTSIYKYEHIGKFKVDVLEEIISDDVTVTKFKNKYIEKCKCFSDCDLVIDCRDFVCNRSKEINIRLYISGKSLIIDCRKNVKTNYQYEGRYIIKLSKSDIQKASSFASQIIASKQIYYFINNQIIHRVHLDFLDNLLQESIDSSISKRIDIIYNSTEKTDKVVNLSEHIIPIIKLNKENPLTICLGEKEHSLFNKTIPKCYIRDSTDVTSIISSMINFPFMTSNFVISVHKDDDGSFVEIIEETGAA